MCAVLCLLLHDMAALVFHKCPQAADWLISPTDWSLACNCAKQSWPTSDIKSRRLGSSFTVDVLDTMVYCWCLVVRSVRDRPTCAHLLSVHNDDVSNGQPLKTSWPLFGQTRIKPVLLNLSWSWMDVVWKLLISIEWYISNCVRVSEDHDVWVCQILTLMCLWKWPV
jgi:hypothetical protein